MLTLKSLKIKNIFSIKKAKLKFDNRPGLYLIYGIKNGKSDNSNGVGKTSIVESINWAAFDNTDKGVSVKSILRKGCSKGSVELKLDANGNELDIIKTRTKGNVTLRLYEGSEDKSYKDVNTTKAYIKKLIGMDYELWSNVVVIGQGRTGVLFDGTDKDRKDLFVKLLKLHVLDKALRYVRDKVRFFKNKSEYYRGKLSGLKFVKSPEINKESYKRIIKNLNIKSEKYRKKQDLYLSKLGKLQSILDTHSRTEQRLLSLSEKYNRDLKKGICPLCKQKLVDSRNVSKELKKVNDEMIVVTKEIEKYSLEKSDNRKMLYCIESKLNKIDSKLESCKIKLDRYLHAGEHNSKIEKYKDKCVLEIKKFSKKINVYDKLESIFGVNGYRKYLIESVLERINREMNELLVGVLDIEVEFFVERTKFDIRVKRNNSIMEKRSLSGGEQKLLSIIFNLAIVNVLVGKNVNCLFYDEILSQLDELNSLNVVRILSVLSERMGYSIYMITNQKHLVENSYEYVSGKIAVIMNKKGETTVRQEII